MGEEEYQEQSNFKVNPYQTPMGTYGSSIIHLTNPEDELRKLELTLRAQIETSSGEIKQSGKSLMNDEGINAVLGMIQTIVNQVTILSNVSEEEIERFMDYFADTMALDLMSNRKRYGIFSSSARDKVYTSAIITTYICIKRAKDGDDKRFWGKVHYVQEINSTNTPQNKGGILGALGWRK